MQNERLKNLTQESLSTRLHTLEQRRKAKRDSYQEAICGQVEPFELFEEDKRERKIFQYFSCRPGLLISLFTGVGTLLAIISKATDYAVNAMFCRYWNVSSAMIQSSGSMNVVYSLVRYSFVVAISLLAPQLTARICDRHYLDKEILFLDRQFMRATYYFAESEVDLLSGELELVKSAEGLGDAGQVILSELPERQELQTWKAAYEVLVKQTRRALFRKWLEALKNFFSFFLKLLLTGSLYFLMFLDLYSVVSKIELAFLLLLAALVTAGCIAPGVFVFRKKYWVPFKRKYDESALHYSYPVKKGFRNREIMRARFIDQALEQIKSRYSSIRTRAWELITSDDNLKYQTVVIVLQCLMIIFLHYAVFGIGFHFTKQFGITTVEGRQYVVIYENDSLFALKPVQIQGSTAAIDVDKTKIVPAPIEYETRTFEKVERK